jgi:DNA-binding Lrp family transcriptional regulator
MPKIPENIQNSFVKLKDELDGTLVLRNLNGHFYVYRASSRWDKKEKRVRSKQEYMGRINSKGIFIEKSASYEEIELEKARVLIEGHGGKVTFDEMPSQALSNNQADVDEIDKKILMILSMNARATMPFIAKMTGLSTSAAEYRVKNLEKRFGIKYILEVDTEKLGYTSYLLLARFEEIKPPIDDLRTTLRKDLKIQFAALVKGDFDLLAFLLDEDAIHTVDNFYTYLVNSNLSKYVAKWDIVPFGQVYSFVPLRDEFIEHVLNVKEQKKLDPSGKLKLRNRELIVFKELNFHSNAKFSDIDIKYKLNKGTSQYAYQQLKSKELLVRSTVNLTNIKIRYLKVIFIVDMNLSKVEENRRSFLLDVLEYGNILNKYCLIGNITTPLGSVLFMPIFNEKEHLNNQSVNIIKELNGVITKDLIITDVLVGTLCYRRFDNTHSRQYKLLMNYNKIKGTKLDKHE